MQFLSNPHGCEGWAGEMAQRIRAFDWATTDLGPIDQWSTSLRSEEHTSELQSRLHLVCRLLLEKKKKKKTKTKYKCVLINQK